MIHTQGCAFILWGQHFEETLATVFATEFRKVGILVKIVGLCIQQARGVHGLTLSPDITLESALRQAGEAVCVIVPCGRTGLQRLENDPRISSFFHQALVNRALFVMNHVSFQGLADSTLLQVLLDHITVSPDSEYLVKTARQIATSLQRL